MIRHKPLTLEQFRWLMIGIAMLLMLICGCGARKVQNDKFKASETTKEQSDSQGQLKKESGSEVTKSSEETSSSTSDYWHKKIEENFNPDGTLKSRITSEEKVKLTFIINKLRLTKQTEYHRVDSVFKTTVTVYKNAVISTNNKKIDANNNALYWTLGILGFFVIVAVFLYFYLKKK